MKNPLSSDFKGYDSIISYCQAVGIKPSEFSRKLGWASSRIYQYRDKINISQASFDHILDVFPNFIEHAVPSKANVKLSQETYFTVKKAEVVLHKNEIKRLFEQAFPEQYTVAFG